MNFGLYDPSSATALDSATVLEVRCLGKPKAGQPTFYTVRIDGGTSSGDPSDREMDQPAVGRLKYQVYKNAARSTIWGDGTGGTAPLVQVLPPSGSPRYNHTAYGRIFAEQNPMPGAYNDVLTVTIEF